MHHILSRKWGILLLLMGIWLVFTIVWASAYVVVPPGSTASYERTKFIFLSISAFGVLFSSLLSSFNSLEATANLRDRLDFDRTENAFQYVARWEAQSLKEARDWTRQVEAERNALSPDDLVRRINGQDNLRRSVITMFNFFEDIELSMRYGRANPDVLRNAFATTYHNIYTRFLPWIERNESQDQQSFLHALDTRWHQP